MIIISGELISILTFPGVMLHEFAHKFFCDINNVPVYEVAYFRITSKSSGHVIHGGAKTLGAGLLIGIGPLIINTIVCMLLTIPYGYATFLGTTFAIPSSIGHNLLAWLGYSIGLNAIPSDQDVKNLDKLAKWEISKVIMCMLQAIICMLNMPYIGFWLHIGYVYLISQLLPAFLLG